MSEERASYILNGDALALASERMEKSIEQRIVRLERRQRILIAEIVTLRERLEVAENSNEINTTS